MSVLRPRPDITGARPNPQAKWVCGYTHLGWVCAEGPDASGACCQRHPNRPPSVTNSAGCDQRCHCAQECALAQLRDQPQLPSQSELGPCIPRRAAWYWRQTLMLNMAILTAGLLLLSMSLPQREAIFAPGTLSQKHSQLLGNHLVSERCSLCHPNSHSQLGVNILQDTLCLKCHSRHLPRAHLRSPHDIPRAELVKLTAKWRPPQAGLGKRVPEHPEVKAAEQAEEKGVEPTSCAMCHIEHHGASFDLTAISDASCQACHQRQFSSLSLGHPQFESYPFRQQRRLAFDHNSHQQKHFGTKNEEFTCTRCHVDQQPSGQVGEVLRTVNFEKGCASCHQAPLETAFSGGWAVLQLPSLDASAALQGTSELPSWPTSARFGYVGEITVPMRLLLMADQRVHTALAQLPASGQLEDIPAAGPLRGQVARSLAQGLYRLIGEVAAEGHVAWKRRLTTAATHLVARDLSEPEMRLINTLGQGIPPDLFRQMDQQWFNSPAAVAARDTIPLRLASQAADADTLLLDEQTDVRGKLSGDALLLESESGPTDDALLLEPLEATSPSVAAEQPGTAPPPAIQPSQLRGSVHVAAGGWYLDHQLLALRYMPAGHADPTLAAWAEFVAWLDAAQQVQISSPATNLTASLKEAAANTAEQLSQQRHAAEFRYLTQGTAVPGGCTQCHLLSAEHGDEQLATNWTARKQPAARRFTKFDHAPHLTLPSLTDCSHCHVLQNDRDDRLGELIRAAEQAPTPVAPTSLSDSMKRFLKHEFVDIRLEQCIACHRPGGANDACIQCHNYHVDSNLRASDWTGP